MPVVEAGALCMAALLHLQLPPLFQTIVSLDLSTLVKSLHSTGYLQSQCWAQQTGGPRWPTLSLGQ